MRKILYITIAIICIILGVIGIFVPGLPTTPFLLLSSWLFYRSSKRMHDALLRSKWLGAYIRQYNKKGGMGVNLKLISILAMWAMISVSTLVFIKDWDLRLLLLFLGVLGSGCIIFIVPMADE